MSRRKKIVCGVLAAAIICIGVLTVWQWNNIGAVFSFLRYSQEELEDQLNQNDQAIKDAMQILPDVSIRDLTQEEKEALLNGTLTQEELADKLVQPTQPPEQKPDPEKTPEKEPEAKPDPKPDPKPEQTPPEPEQSEYDKQLAAIIAKVYVLREEFLAKLDQLQVQAIAEYKAIPKEERTTSAIAQMVSGYLVIGNNMEKECDAQIEQIILELEQFIQKNGGDMDIAQTVYDTYVKEKKS